MVNVSEIKCKILGLREQLAPGIMRAHYERVPGLAERYGDKGQAAALRDTKYNMEYLAQAIEAESPELFAHYMSWLQSVLEAYGVPAGDLKQHLLILDEKLREHLPLEMHAPMQTVLSTGIKELEQPPRPLPSFINPSAPYAAIAQYYLDAVLKADRNQACKIIMDQVNAGASVKDLYLNVFEPVQYEIGRLWQTNQINVAQEHYATAVTQLAMSQLYPYIFSTPKNGYRLLATCVGGELHEIGVRMVADMFEVSGWDTHYLGANTPMQSVLATTQKVQPHIVAISATMMAHLDTVRALIVELRANLAHNTKIMVGGYPFNLVPDLWEKLGADGSARQAQAAIQTAQQLITE